VSNNIQSQI